MLKEEEFKAVESGLQYHKQIDSIYVTTLPEGLKFVVKNQFHKHLPVYTFSRKTLIMFVSDKCKPNIHLLFVAIIKHILLNDIDLPPLGLSSLQWEF